MGRKAQKKKSRPKASRARSQEAPEGRARRVGPPLPSIRRSYLVASLLILTVLTAAAYANSLQGPFVLDDKSHIMNEPAIRSPLSLEKLFATDRPMVRASLALNYSLSELRVGGYHVLNVLAHLACGLLLFGFARYTFLLPVFGERYRGRAEHLALFASGLFLLHPIQTESVTYVIQRAEIFAGFALIGGMWIAAVAARAPTWWRPLPGLMLIGGFGLLSKPTFVVLPLLFALYDWCFIAQGRLEPMARRWPLYLVLGTLGLGTGVWGWTQADKGGAGFGLEGIEPLQYLASQAGVVLYYVRLILIPDRLCFDCGYFNRPWPVVHSWLGDMVWIPAIVLGTAAVVAWRARRRFPLVMFCAWGSAIVLAPTSSIMPFSSAYVEHRLYMVIAFVALLLATVLFDLSEAAASRGWLPAKPVRVARLGGAVVLWAVLLSLTIARNQLYADPLRLWQDSVAKAPESRRAQYNLGNLYLNRGEPENSLEHYQAAIRSNAGSRVYVNLGLAYIRLGRYADAVPVLEAARERQRDSGLIHQSLSTAYERLGRFPDAIDAAERAVKLRPRRAGYRKQLGALYARGGRSEEALREYRAVARLNPRDKEVRRRIEELTGELGGP